MTDPETPDGAYERLLRETRLGEWIEELEGVLGSCSLYVVSRVELMLLIDQLRELRARRIAMGREPDDEVNAPADMCCCNVCLQGAPAKQFRGGCPLHPRPELAHGAPLRDAADEWPAGTRRSRNAVVIAFARETWPNDGAEGETVHLLCDELERLMGKGHPRPELTGAEFLEAATEALGDGLELREGISFCVGCGSRDCTCEPAAAELGPRLRCGAFRLLDCGGISSCETLCEPADEAFPF